jgi:hypothetical protein
MNWLVAKFMPDLRRRETRNVGVVVLPSDDSKPALRFMGRGPSGDFDGRKAKVGTESAVLQGWIEYWFELAERRAPLAEWIRRSQIDAFFLEPGGQLLSELPTATTAADLAEELFTLVVEPPRAPNRRSNEAEFVSAVENLLSESGLTGDQHFRTKHPVDLGEYRHFSFDYAWVNGHTTVGQRMASWKPDSVDATALRLALLPAGHASVLFVSDIPSTETAGAIEKLAYLAQVDQVSPADVREMFVNSKPTLASSPPARFAALQLGNLSASVNR